MAKRLKSRRGRGPKITANLWLPRVIQVPPRSSLKIYEDRRIYHPARARPVRTKRRVASIRASRLTSLYSPPINKIEFTQPKQVLICVRRQRRREILHALGKAGQKGQRKPKRNFWSEVSC